MTDFAAFVDELRAAANPYASFDDRKAFRARHATLLAQMLVCLDEVGVIGANPMHVDPPANCDLCSADLSQEVVFIDGETRLESTSVSDPDGVTRQIGTWANMCFACFSRDGVAIGWGSGQLYVQRRPNEWQCIAGGDPRAQDLDE